MEGCCPLCRVILPDYIGKTRCKLLLYLFFRKRKTVLVIVHEDFPVDLRL